MNPNKTVFLGGTCNSSTWRDRLIPMLKIGYFNPVTTDWTKDHIVEEVRQREICDICLYVITPAITEFYAIAEVIDDSNKRPEKTILVVLEQDDDLTFTAHQSNSLDRIMDMVLVNGVERVFDNLEDVADFINGESRD